MPGEEPCSNTVAMGSSMGRSTLTSFQFLRRYLLLALSSEAPGWLGSTRCKDVPSRRKRVLRSSYVAMEQPPDLSSLPPTSEHRDPTRYSTRPRVKLGCPDARQQTATRPISPNSSTVEARIAGSKGERYQTEAGTVRAWPELTCRNRLQAPERSANLPGRVRCATLLPTSA